MLILGTTSAIQCLRWNMKTPIKATDFSSDFPLNEHPFTADYLERMNQLQGIWLFCWRREKMSMPCTVDSNVSSSLCGRLAWFAKMLIWTCLWFDIYSSGSINTTCPRSSVYKTSKVSTKYKEDNIWSLINGKMFIKWYQSRWLRSSSPSTALRPAISRQMDRILLRCYSLLVLWWSWLTSSRSS